MNVPSTGQGTTATCVLEDGRARIAMNVPSTGKAQIVINVPIIGRENSVTGVLKSTVRTANQLSVRLARVILTRAA